MTPTEIQAEIDRLTALRAEMSAGKVGQSEALGRGALQGLSVGLADEAAGTGAQKKAHFEYMTKPDTLKALNIAAKAGDWELYRAIQKQGFRAGNEARDNRLETYRQQDTAASEQWPKTYLAGEIGGGIAPAALTGGSGYAAMAPKTLIGRIGAGAGTGAIDAFTYGFNQGDGGFGNRAKAGAYTAPFGATLGGLTPAAGHLVGAGWRKVRNAVVDRVPESTGMLSDILNWDDLDFPSAARRVDDLGEGALPLDVGPNAASAGGAIAATPGRGQTTVRRAIDARSGESAKARSARALTETFGPRENQYLAGTAERQARLAAAKKGYEKAFTENWGTSGPPKALDDVLSRLQPSDLTEARIIAKSQGVPFGGQLLADIVDDGTVTFKRLPTVAEAEYIRRAVKDRASASFANSKSGAGTAAKDLERELRGIIDDANPTLKAVRQKYADDIAVETARKEGRKVFSNATDFDEMEVTYPQKSGAEKGAYRSGARSAAGDIADTASWNAQDPVRRMRSDRNVDKVRLIVGDEKANNFVKHLENERVKQMTNAAVTSNSETARRQAVQALMGIKQGSDVSWTDMIDLTKPLNLGKVPFDILNKDRLVRKNSDRLAELARLLTDKDALVNAAQYGPRLENLSKAEKKAALVARLILQGGNKPLAARGGNAVGGGW